MIDPFLGNKPYPPLFEDHEVERNHDSIMYMFPVDVCSLGHIAQVDPHRQSQRREIAAELVACVLLGQAGTAGGVGGLATYFNGLLCTMPYRPYLIMPLALQRHPEFP
jgi:hypothetical protein